MKDEITAEGLYNLVDTVSASLIKEQFFCWGHVNKEFYEELFGIELSDVDEQRHKGVLWVRLDSEVNIKRDNKEVEKCQQIFI